MTDVPREFDRQDAMLLGLVKAVQALTAVTYHTSPKRDALEEQFKIYLAAGDLEGDLLRAYKAPLEGMLKIIDEIKAAQPKN